MTSCNLEPADTYALGVNYIDSEICISINLINSDSSKKMTSRLR